MILTRVRPLLAVALALGAILLVASPAAAYNEENVASIQAERLDPVSCATPIRINFLLLDSQGQPVQGAVVQFSYAKSASGDSIAPKSTASDASGIAQTTLDLTCTNGSRTVQASVPGDGSAQIVVTCGASQGCTGGATLPNTAVDVTSPVEVATGGDGGPLGGSAALLLALIVVAAMGLIVWSRRRLHSRP